jgi:hypothetical protein
VGYKAAFNSSYVEELDSEFQELVGFADGYYKRKSEMEADKCDNITYEEDHSVTYCEDGSYTVETVAGDTYYYGADGAYNESHADGSY